MVKPPPPSDSTCGTARLKPAVSNVTPPEFTVAVVRLVMKLAQFVPATSLMPFKFNVLVPAPPAMAELAVIIFSVPPFKINVPTD